eukprot:4162214-Pleurochrysis_carterae.AAC.1
MRQTRHVPLDVGVGGIPAYTMSTKSSGLITVFGSQRASRCAARHLWILGESCSVSLVLRIGWPIAWLYGAVPAGCELRPCSAVDSSLGSQQWPSAMLSSHNRT